MKRYYLSLQLVGLLASLPLAYEDTLQWDITVRDFEPDHADFENFDERTDSIAIHPLSELSSTYSRTSGAYQCYGERFATYNPTAGADTSYWSCEDGYACSAEHPQAYYGAYTFPTIDATVDAVDGDVDSMATSYTCHRHEALAYAQAAAAAGVGSGAIKKTVWEERVFVTRGMVANQLCMSTTQDGCSGYTSIDADDPYTWIPRPLHPTMGCHSDNFDQWFQDNSEFNKTINTTMSLILVDASTGLYTINSKTMPGQAYFPLDTVTSVPTWGKQTLKFWCPPYDGGWNETGSKLSNLCEDLLTVYGGPRSLISAGNAANYYGADSLLHNYFFTIAGITSFKYHSGDTFIFSGDDDMWVFVDGYLVADLGGTHNPAEARLVMSDIAKDLISRGDTMGIDASNSSTWRDTSAHYLHFFYADRQSDGSNLRITTTISDTRIPRNGSPKIDHAEIDGDTLYLYVNTALSEATLSAMNSSPYSVGSSSNYFPIIGTKWKSSITANDVGDLDTTTYLDTLGLTVSSIFYSGMNDGWYVYGVVADYCDTVTCDVMTSKVSSGDSLSFNF
ncbi:MAG TPA: fibro-slime domain-containing protein, partial [Fibrobacteraceae bacterium]|nr:fibro-slime domain-containing protein [Fibrobacteraceae bacterium]